MVAVYGFPNKKEALAFEWNWQKPFLSKAVRNIANSLVAQKTLGNRWKLKFKMRIMFEMLRLSPWNRFPLTLHWMGRTPLDHPALFPTLPDLPSHMKQVYAPITQLDMLLQQNAESDEEGLASGEEEHTDDEDAAQQLNDPRALAYNYSTGSGANTPRVTEERDENSLPTVLDVFRSRNGLLPQRVPSESNLMGPSNTSSSQPITDTAPRRSLSTGAILDNGLGAPAASMTQPSDYHNRSIDEDDDSFLFVPAFAPKATSSTGRNARNTSAKRSRSAMTPTTVSEEEEGLIVPNNTENTNISASASTQQRTRASSVFVACKLCTKGIEKLEHGLCCLKEECQASFHITCFATVALKEENAIDEKGAPKYLVPTMASCPSCKQRHRWMDLIRHKQRWMNHPTNPLRPLIQTSFGPPDLASFRR